MSGPSTPPPSPGHRPEKAPAQRPLRWFHYAGPVVFALFCIELGVLLVLAPWLDVYEHNRLLFLRPEWRPFLLSHTFRGALSGLGFLNFIVALNEFIDLARLSDKQR